MSDGIDGLGLFGARAVAPRGSRHEAALRSAPDRSETTESPRSVNVAPAGSPQSTTFAGVRRAVVTVGPSGERWIPAWDRGSRNYENAERVDLLLADGTWKSFARPKSTNIYGGTVSSSDFVGNDGSHLLGFGDFQEAYVGGPPPGMQRGGPVKGGGVSTKGPGKGAVTQGRGAAAAVYGMSKTKSPHKGAVLSAIAAGNKAVEAGRKGAATAKAYKPSAHAPLVKLSASMSPKGRVMLGLAPGKKALTPKQAKAVAKHVNAIARHAQANKRLNIAASQATKAGTAALSFAKAAAPFLKKKLEARSSSAAGGGRAVGYGWAEDDVDLLGEDEAVELYDLLGEYLGEDPPPVDPNAPPAEEAVPLSAGGVDPTTGIVTDPWGNIVYDPSTDPAIVPMPVRGEKLSKEEAQQYWREMPDDGIPYVGRFGGDSVGSYVYFYGDIPGVQRQGRHEGGAFLFLGSGSGSDPVRWQYRWQGAEGEWHGASEATDVKVAESSQARGWGPLIGNPNNSQTAGIQFAMASGKWFWQGKYAPVSATAEADAKIALANQKTVEANTKAALTQVAQMVKKEADRIEEEAKREAAFELARRTAEEEKIVATTKAETAEITEQQAQEALKARADIEYQKTQDVQEAEERRLEAEERRAGIEAEREQRKIDAEAQREEAKLRAAEIEAWRDQARLDTEAQRAEQHDLVTQADIYNEWARAHPEEAVEQMVQQYEPEEGGDPFEDGGQSMDEGGYEGEALFDDEV